MLEVWPSRSIGSMVFTQLDARSVEIDVSDIELNGHGAVIAREIGSGAGYRLQVAESTDWPELSGDLRSKLLVLPNVVDERVVELSEKLFEGAVNSQEKMFRVTSFFHGAYTYNLGIEIPKGEDPLTYFLTERPPGHCKLFASGAALLFRLGGVPCRYVTGYVAMEWNPVGEYWVARSRDAHAWVEAWDDEAGWMVVEATPANGVPGGEEKTSRFSYICDEIKFQWQKFRGAISLGQIVGYLKELVSGFVRGAWQFLVSGGWILVIGGGIVSWLVRWMRKRARRAAEEVSDAAPYHELLERVDALMEGRGVSRGSSETLGRFSERLLDGYDEDALMVGAAEWYREYAAARYDPLRDVGAEAAVLGVALEELEADRDA